MITTEDNSGYVVRCYGITKDPETKNFMMVMEYAQNGSLRQHLNNSFNSLNWNKKRFATFFANAIPSPKQTMSASLVLRPIILSLTNPPIK